MTIQEVNLRMKELSLKMFRTWRQPRRFCLHTWKRAGGIRYVGQNRVEFYDICFKCMSTRARKIRWFKLWLEKKIHSFMFIKRI